MFNLLMKDIKLGVHPMFFVMPLLTGALMFIPGWIYLLVLLYFCWITIPNMFGAFKSQNDLMFTAMMPVTKKDIVKARISVVVILELLHIGIAMILGFISIGLYPNLTYIFFYPHFGFWGVCFVMLAIFNIIFFIMYFKTAYNYGAAAITSIAAAMLFAGIAQWIAIQNSYVYDLFNGTGVDDLGLQLSILAAGIVIFIVCTLMAYRVSVKRFLRVEI